MTGKVYLVTPPDDLLIDGTRILLADLTVEQTQLISDALTAMEEVPNIIVYVWKHGDDSDWMLDKKHKANLIIFNAESEDQVMAGYLLAQRNSHYFGTLRSMQNVNKSAIYNTDDCIAIIEKSIISYE